MLDLNKISADGLIRNSRKPAVHTYMIKVLNKFNYREFSHDM